MRPLPETLAQRLLPAVAEKFAERGYEGTRLEDLASAAGIPRATLYYYFTGKADILAFLLTNFVDSVSETVGKSASSTGTARKRLERVIDDVLRLMAANPVVIRALVPSFSRVTAVPEIEKAVSEAFLEPVTQIFGDGVRDGEIRMRTEDMEASAVAILYALTFLVLHYQLRDPDLPVDRIRRAVHRSLDGIWQTK